MNQGIVLRRGFVVSALATVPLSLLVSRPAYFRQSEASLDTRHERLALAAAVGA